MGEPTLAEVVRTAWPELQRASFLSSHQWKTLRALVRCRTPALGEHVYECTHCGKEHRVPHSCGNRHCPRCQAQQAIDWLERQQANLLPIPYFHVVVTLPHELNSLIRQNQKLLFELLFASGTKTLLEFGRRKWKAQLGLTAVLHTWGQNLNDHYHLHCLVTGGGLNPEGTQWIGASAKYLFPIKALAIVFGAKYRDGLQQLYAQGKLKFHGQLVPLSQPSAFQALMRQVTAKSWRVYAKRPFAGPSQVLAYLGRYTHRVAITPRRLRRLDRVAGTVTFAWKDYADGQKRKEMTLSVVEFVRRFALHILPARLAKIRHFGLLGNRNLRQRLAQALACLSQTSAQCIPDVESQSPTSAPTPEGPAPLACPYCRTGQLRLVAVVWPWRSPIVALLDSS